MTITPRFKKEVIALVGGTLFAFVIAALCGVRRTAFASTPSAFGIILLVLAARSLVASLLAQKRPANIQQP
jgi:ABC-type multidrug transport system permease subunit